jgi:hypothetical protein
MRRTEALLKMQGMKEECENVNEEKSRLILDLGVS